MMAYTYESILIFNGDLTEEEYLTNVSKFRDYLISNTRKLKKTDKFTGKKKLAYEIKGCRDGWYVVFYFQATPDFIPEWERILRIDDNVIKFMTVKNEDEDAEEVDEEDVESEQEDSDPNKSIDAMDVLLGFANYIKRGEC